MLARDGISHMQFTAYNENNLWWHYSPIPNKETLQSMDTNTRGVVRHLSTHANYQLWHHRLGHPGEKVMSLIHKQVKGVPKLHKHQFFNCAACLTKNLRKAHIGDRKQYIKTKETPKNEDIQPGQRLHMDFGFVRGSDWKRIDTDGKLVTSNDGYRSYLLIVDRKTRYSYIFLTKTKQPPLQEVRGILTKYAGVYRDCSVTTDNGGELAKSVEFRRVIRDAGYTLKTTGAFSSAQNGLVEKPNQDIARIVRALLYSSNLGSQYWSYAIRHAVYLKNRLPHSALQWKTPYEALLGTQPDLSKLKAFGARVSVHSGGRKAKLDDISEVGTFLNYKGTDKVIYVKDRKTGREKTATHAFFDEAFMAETSTNLPPMALALQQAGYRTIPNSELQVPPVEIDDTTLHIKLLSKTAKMPIRGTTSSAGLDIFSDENISIGPGEQHLLSTSIAVEIPKRMFGKLEIRSGLAAKHSLGVAAGIIDNDYRGELKVILRNHGVNKFEVRRSDRMAQLILIPQPPVTVNPVESFKTSTSRGTAGFGSTGIRQLQQPTTSQQPEPQPTVPPVAPTTIQEAIPTASPSMPINIIPTTAEHVTVQKSLTSSISPRPHLIPMESNEHQKSIDDYDNIIPVVSKTEDAPTNYDLIHDDFIPSCNIDLSTDPYIDKLTITLLNKGKHPTRGMILQPSKDYDNTVEILACQKSTPAAKIKRWRTRMKHQRLLAIDDIPIYTKEDVESFFNMLPNTTKTVNLTIGTLEKHAMNHDEGVPMMYFDQLVTIARHLNNIKYDLSDATPPSSINQSNNSKTQAIARMLVAAVKHGTIHAVKAAMPKAILPKSKQRSNKLTRRKLKHRNDWTNWLQSEWKQLDQYNEQQTFGEPCMLPPGANILDLLWTYNIKDDGTLKARCVCNGRPSNKNTAIFGHTFAKSLDQVGSRIFWATSALKNMIVRGADASNAFAEADAPKIPLYVRIDQQFRDWWKQRYPDKILPDDFVLPVKKALQGHPESPRAWATLINSILVTKMQFKPTKHEPCLYYGTYEGHEILFLRQVDDFAVACTDGEICKKVIGEIDKYMKIKIKDLGLLSRYNGVDIDQTQDYIKLHANTYIEKILIGHPWFDPQKFHHHKPIPMKSETEYIHRIESSVPPITERDKIDLQHEMGFNYRQGIGELLYAMVTCRVDIAFPVIKLSQYAINPSKIHYEAVKDIFYYLSTTKEDGLIYWRQRPVMSLPKKPDPPIISSEQPLQDENRASLLFGAVDSDWAGDTSHRKSVTGIILRLAGGTILYKTKYQDTIAFSSTEAEYTAAVDAGKAILYVRSILDEIHVPQEAATNLYIDNNGALLMGNAQQPTRNTRHMELKKFALIDWIQQDLILLQRVTSANNYSDPCTKPLGRTLYYKHFDYIMGRIRPTYASEGAQIKCTISLNPLDDRINVLKNIGGVSY
jgi:dUTP pyrophosphatase